MSIARGLASSLAVAAFAFAGVAEARVSTDSSVYVERGSRGDMRTLENVDSLSPGDRIVTIVRWKRQDGRGGFTITNPLPEAVAYQSSGQPYEEVSVDGGRTWGRLGTLRIGTRLASPEDVTHVRWHIPARRAAQGRGQIAYSGIVR
ncbi:hypothetical protein GCM10011371_07880 [Novosphingobium marinum]|uniref:DUF11 domain-containing protein n=1 Tax=Novosphingobium marinum TaxID=1514948 RepID=A0A7Z0BS35_9SPHN|nr:hypothetical protein [Novosphingobium marinum]NYH94476.1 hypothetical protein [Novosphingobium marinum]GGC22600.1 hypothetical protein GCM10011371_07880 [Novosphingobium marinum]